MSGGSLNYCRDKILEAATGIEGYIDADKREIERRYSEDTIAILERAALIGREFAILAHEAEWMFSCDTSEETFLENTKKQVDELYKSRCAPPHPANGVR